MRVVTCVFPGPAVYAKGARGAMCRHVVVNEVTDVEGLKAFVGNDGEWSFSSETKLDDKNMTLTFSRSDTKKKAAATGGMKAKAAKGARLRPPTPRSNLDSRCRRRRLSAPHVCGPVFSRVETFGWRATVSFEFFRSQFGQNSVRIQEHFSEFFRNS